MRAIATACARAIGARRSVRGMTTASRASEATDGNGEGAREAAARDERDDDARDDARDAARERGGRGRRRDGARGWDPVSFERVRAMRRALHANDFDGVRREFEALTETAPANRVAWNLSVFAAARAREPEAALSIVESMLAENLAPCFRTHTGVMEAYVRAGRHREAFNWLRMLLYGVPGDLQDETMDEKYDLSHVIGGMMDGEEDERPQKKLANSMMFTVVLNGAAKAGDREMVQELETMMFEFDITPGADTLHCLMKLEGRVGTSASVEAVWNRSKKKARALKAHQERVVAHAFLGRKHTPSGAESRSLALKALDEMFKRVGRRRSDEEFAKLTSYTHRGSAHARWTGARGQVEYKKGLDNDKQILNVGRKESLVATNAVMNTFAAIGDLDTVNECFVRLEEELGIGADTRTFNALLRAEYAKEKLKTGVVDMERFYSRFEEVLAAMDDRDVQPNRYTFTTLLLAYAEQSNLNGVAQVLKLMQERELTLDRKMYNILLGACARAGDLEAALNARASMAQSGVQAGPDTFVPLFAACTKQANEFSMQAGEDFFEDEEEVGPLLEDTRRMLDGIELDMLSNDIIHNTRSFTALLKARGALGQADIVLEMLSDPPDAIELDGCGVGIGILALSKREPTKAIAFADSFIGTEYEQSLWILNSAIIAYGRLGQIKAAHDRVRTFIENGGVPNVATYNALFECASEGGGFAEYAPLIMSDMSSRDLKPDSRTKKYLTVAAMSASAPDREMSEELLKKLPADADSFQPSPADLGDDEHDFDASSIGFDDDFDDDDHLM